MISDRVKIAFIGAGAIGSLFGGLLSKGGEDVLLIGRQPHIDAISKNGLFISGVEEFNVKIDSSSNPFDAIGSDLMIITTKAYDTRDALKDIVPILERDTIVMSLQNGAGNIEEISKFVEKQNILGSVTSMGAFIESPGKIQYRGKGKTFIGPYSEKNNCAKEVVKIFKKAGITAEYTNDIESEIWSKVIINSAINPLASIFDGENGILLDKNLLEIVREVTIEGKMILDNDGITIPDDIFEKTLEVIKNTSKNINSTLLDLRKGNKTEIDYITGKIVETGERLGIPAPFNKALLNILKFKENKLIQKS
ncbi:MAG: 2-dehydropantoate 2-reductase [Candidatus Methanofastidiosum methylothiophilum]|uniref:2-dehydropantoate 2-reductase n=1 Tax=Candidatus Methanofastidiosum methylothiophilum TaxID=1705564 RepID=A0A150ILN2_9EURY|nr:MAG: 2-dehydropantoate 2-reductase [Candidatus Methanofastidiosum methylthiophilus]KYC47976.1 MAG: 2-dehydropantoate 2-reductase [Candidatus Methanofastidiosum methylthiophilus]KYC50594.1 MAG: 2-dehydropantoate 2-reductase [Candidatus Methanofastidiosum methylthiophilus]